MKLKRDKYLIADEFKRLLYAARTRPHKNAQRDYALLSTGGLIGCRVSELVGIRVGDLLLTADPPFARVERRKKRTKHVVDDVAIPPTAHKALVAYLRTLSDGEKKPGDRVFPITTRQALRVFKRYARIAGLSRAYSTHALRHYRGLSLYEESGGNLEIVRESLGHTNLSSTQVYIHTHDQLKKAALVDVDMEGFTPS